MTEPTALAPWEERIATVAAFLLARMPDDMVRECQALVALDPESIGLRLVHEPATDRFSFLWVGRDLGSVPGAWLREGIEVVP
jgi:hypothetical protein